MNVFDLGETVICSITVKDSSDALQDPATSMEITITDAQGTVKIDSVAMTKDSTGTYNYDDDTSAEAAGVYSIKYTATDGSRVSIQGDSFSLV